MSGRGPDGLKKLVGLATKKCTSCEGKDAKAMDSEQANKLRNQVPGWRLVQTAGGQLSLRQDWQARPGLTALGQRAVFERCSVPSFPKTQHTDHPKLTAPCHTSARQADRCACCQSVGIVSTLCCIIATTVAILLSGHQRGSTQQGVLPLSPA